MFSYISEQIGFIDVLVNNAGDAQRSNFFNSQQGGTSSRIFSFRL